MATPYLLFVFLLETKSNTKHVKKLNNEYRKILLESRIKITSALKKVKPRFTNAFITFEKLDKFWTFQKNIKQLRNKFVRLLEYYKLLKIRQNYRL